MTLRVVFDATPIPRSLLGAGVYVTELLRAMPTGHVDLDVLVSARDVDELRAMLPAARLHVAHVRGRPLRLAWGHSILPLRVRRLRPDVFHGPHYTLPRRVGVPSVVTFHDPTFFTHPHLHERAKVAYFTRTARAGIKRATRTIAVSSYAIRGAIEHAGANPDRIDLVYEGVDLSRYRPAPPEAEAPATPYVLFVGALEPRKDVPTLVEAYGQLVTAGYPHHLVLCGLPAWGVAAIEHAIARLGAGTVRRTGYVTEAQKIELYQGASVFVYPSIAEGFGLPVLEAMACGTPVVTTTGSAPEEIAGEAALLVPPGDIAALRKAIGRAIDDAELAEELRRRGRRRAADFTWERAAAATIDVWQRAAGGSET